METALCVGKLNNFQSCTLLIRKSQSCTELEPRIPFPMGVLSTLSAPPRTFSEFKKRSSA